MANKAFLAGINNYKSVSDLRGCISDVEKMEKLLTGTFDFSRQNVRTLADQQVVKRNVMEQLDWLIEGAQAEDQLVFFFAGHGSQVVDVDGDEEEDGVDEILCLWDMDFDKPDTYLLDDDINTFTQRLPEGASLTIVFDCCHSGTATRMLLAPDRSRSLALAPNKTPLVDLEVTANRSEDDLGRSLSPKKAMKRLLTPTTEAEQRQVVLARYIEPPRKVLDVMHRRGARSTIARPRNEASMNHVFFAASQSTQTSADAFINSGYHGAFSYYFCQAAKKYASDSQKLLSAVRSALRKGGFSQVPQLEPSSAKGPLFAGRIDAPSKRPADSAGPTKSPPGPAAGAQAPPDVELYSEIVGLLQNIVDKLGLPARMPGGKRAAGQRSLVYVHGICRHDAGYSDGWFNALSPHLSAALRAQLQGNRHEVLWSDLVTAVRDLDRDVPERVRRARQRREEELAEYLRDVVEDRAHREALKQVPKQRDLRPRAMEIAIDRGALDRGLNCIDDFPKYLLRPTIRRAVQKRFLDVVVPLLDGGSSIDIMGHSWGTVVAYESLRQLDSRSFPGQIGHFFTIGSALSIVPIQRRLETGDYVKPRCVRRWINLDADGDFVGGALASLGYGVDRDFLNLDPVGCGFFLTNPACPHSSYFKAANTAVNREIFARYMNGA